MKRTVAIRLKIPDNQAYTALATLRRMGVELARLERAEIVRLSPGEAPTFNHNKHMVNDVPNGSPIAGEMWIEELGAPDRFVAWKLVGTDGKPATRAVLESAAQLLLCNPAIEKAHFA